jgi:hypothetical protein
MTSPAGHDLDELLAAWAQARRLPDVDAEQIRQAVVPTLSETWWSDFSSKMSAVVTRATTTPVPALAALYQ